MHRHSHGESGVACTRGIVNTDPIADEIGNFAAISQPGTSTLFDALIPLAILVPMLALFVYPFGADSFTGPKQLVLLVSAAATVVVACVSSQYPSRSPYSSARRLGLGQERPG